MASVTICSQPSFPCPVDHCLKLFWTRNHLDRHIKTPHNLTQRKMLSCKHCDRQFKHKFNLKIHEAVHTGDKPLACEQCGAAFVMRNRLKQHMKTHKIYRCDLESCTFTCDKWTLLRKHISERHKKKCPSCSRKFSSDECLERHVLTHELVLKCSHCDLSYSNKSNLTSHVRSVHEKITYKCTFEGCNKELQHRKSLRNHLNFHKKSGQQVKKLPRKIISVRNVLVAELVTGVKVDEEKRTEMLIQDKMFRTEFPEFQQGVRIL